MFYNDSLCDTQNIKHTLFIGCVFLLGVIKIIGFALDSSGDVVFQKNKIVMISDKELTAQTIRTVLNTNKNEWFLNTDEGITFSNILVKNPDYDAIKAEVAEGLKQVNEDFMLKSFDYNLGENRKLDIRFEATDGKEDILYSSDTVNLNFGKE